MYLHVIVKKFISRPIYNCFTVLFLIYFFISLLQLSVPLPYLFHFVVLTPKHIPYTSSLIEPWQKDGCKTLLATVLVAHSMFIFSVDSLFT